jgi:hypothetical protein
MKRCNSTGGGLGSQILLETFDQRDFHTYRWKNRRPFRNLLLTS